MTNAATTPRTWTVADLDDLPDTEGLRYEIIDGELLVSRNPDADHQWVMWTITTALNNWSLPRQAGKAYGTVGLLFSSTDNVIPDVMWVSQARELEIRRADRKFYGAPELVVEILSPGAANEQRDRLKKLRLYQTQGVQEYWIVDWRTQQIVVYRLEAGLLGLVATLNAADTLTSPLLPDFACVVGSLFELT